MLSSIFVLVIVDPVLGYVSYYSVGDSVGFFNLAEEFSIVMVEFFGSVDAVIHLNFWIAWHELHEMLKWKQIWVALKCSITCQLKVIIFNLGCVRHHAKFLFKIYSDFCLSDDSNQIRNQLDIPYPAYCLHPRHWIIVKVFKKLKIQSISLKLLNQQQHFLLSGFL